MEVQAAALHGPRHARMALNLSGMSQVDDADCNSLCGASGGVP